MNTKTEQSESYIINKTRQRLRDAGYNCIWQCFGPNDSILIAFSNGKRVLILHDMDENGFELYKPASSSNDVESTLKGAGL